ncbi:MAG TPA: tetratricopeptide repeat protein [Tepidisphaeraceae bacterium]|jgi:predicted O-linked N-acetylglucosamine transferase (SPINDLY family)
MNPNQVRQTIQQGLALHQQGHLANAEALYRQVLQAAPLNPDALRLLGLLLHQAGHSAEALPILRRAIEVAPRVPAAHNTLGEALRATGQFVEAEAAYRNALKLNAQMPEAWNNLGNALHQMGRVDEAREAYERAIAIKPDYFRAYINLANFHLMRREHSAAEPLLRKALALNPNFAGAHASLGEAMLQQNRFADALPHYREAARLAPNEPDIIDGLGRTYRHLDQLPAALAAYRAAVQLNPNDARLRVNLGEVLFHVGQISAATEQLQKALEIQPNLPAAMTNLASALSALGRHEEAISHLRRAIEINPGDRMAHSNLLMHLHYVPSDPKELFGEHVRWAQQHVAPSVSSWITVTANPATRGAGDKIRLAYVSPDLWRHPVAAFLEPLLKHHDRTKFEIIAYSDTSITDEMTARLKTYFNRWHDTATLSDEALAERVREDGVDVLIDLAGHTAKNRLMMFAQRPAPVQVTYLGYPNTTGLSQMDYRITDALADPPGEKAPAGGAAADALHTEKLTRLPHCFLCYAPPDVAPAIQARPERPITFGSFNRVAKISAETFRAWAEILRRLPESRLMVKSTYLADEPTRAEVQKLFTSFGIRAEQLLIQPPVQGFANHLDSYNAIDIALDPFPYNGTTTTCEALWMGVPVISLAGTTHVSRVGVSLLTNAGLQELVARDVERYCDQAVALAGDRARLASYRQHLRNRLEQSPLLDAKRFTSDVEAALLAVAQRA